MKARILTLALAALTALLLAACDGDTAALVGASYDPLTGEQGARLEGIALEEKGSGFQLRFSCDGVDYDFTLRPDATADSEDLDENAAAYSTGLELDENNQYALLLKTGDYYSGLVRELEDGETGFQFAFILAPDEQALEEILSQLQASFG